MDHDRPRRPFRRADLEAWFKLMPPKDLDLIVGVARAKWERRVSRFEAAAGSASRQLIPASDFPPEILSLIFSHVDTATLLGAVPHVCRDWRAACAHDVHGPKVRLELHSVQQMLRIRPECLGLWVAAMVGRFAWVIDLDLSRCGIEDGALECAGSLQRITSLNVGGDYRCPSKITDMGLEHLAQLTQLTSLDLSGDIFRPSKITDTGLEHVAQLTQLTSLDLGGCDNITDTGLEHVPNSCS